MNESGNEPEISFPKGLSAYVRTRLQLISLETQEALVHLQGKMGPLVAVVICGLSAYVLVLAAVISLLGKALFLLTKNEFLGWEVIALGTAGLHIVIIKAMKAKITRKPKSPLFEYSRAELERDREWIHEHNPTSKS
ncbi:phage holin family protein [Roseibacillus ishigakijimensis]|uniref:Phage holin family protein n=1 Tax=Roseibacillus ishigakijimensis TaxID=454146 RepID=A0A934VLX1_9BACT|nr:phage holin family protein [Roseibacillus ishigakijimensis]MBK1835129.1 phage holin family protein [Roseibacillus ishigakijimensis]